MPNLQYLINLSQALAHTLMLEVKEEERLYGQFLAFDFNTTSNQAQSSTKFQRAGVTGQSKNYNLPADLVSLIKQAYTSGAPTPAVESADKGFLLDLLTRNNTQQPGANLLEALQQVIAGQFKGAPALDNIIARNPYSTDYEQATQGMYDRQFNVARSKAQTGPDNVRGGQARTAFELADLDTQMSTNRFKEIRDTQHQEAGVVSQAVQIANTIDSMRKGTSLQAQQAQVAGEHARTSEALEGSTSVARSRASNLANLQLASEMLGTANQATSENLKGEGQQIQSSSGSGWNAGVSCCFIFLEVLGALPYFVRKGRDEFDTPNRRAGYRWMSKWLVPKMQKSRFWKWLGDTFIVQPFLNMGAIYYGKHTAFGSCRSLILRPYCFAWLYLWSFIGYTKGECVYVFI